MSKPKQFTRPDEPLSPTAFYILLSLAGQARHGYDILKQVALSSAGAVRLGPGALYTTIRRLLDAGLISEVVDHPDDGDERRRYYELTDSGRGRFATEVRRLEDAIALARQTAGLGAPPRRAGAN